MMFCEVNLLRFDFVSDGIYFVVEELLLRILVFFNILEENFCEDEFFF